MNLTCTIFFTPSLPGWHFNCQLFFSVQISLCLIVVVNVAFVYAQWQGIMKSSSVLLMECDCRLDLLIPISQFNTTNALNFSAYFSISPSLPNEFHCKNIDSDVFIQCECVVYVCHSADSSKLFHNLRHNFSGVRFFRISASNLTKSGCWMYFKWDFAFKIGNYIIW